MGWSGHHMTDPSDIENRFSNEDAISQMESVFTEPSEESLVKIDRVRGMLDQLPPREADFVDLYFFRHINQTDIAGIFGVSQPTVCYRLKRATARIQFLLQLPAITRPELEEAMTGFLADPLDAKIMVLMWETTCQSEVAKRLGVTQGLVRHRFIRAVKQMKTQDNLLALAEMFDTIADNLNILREVRRPSWDGRWTHVID
jgi:DNA-directed RNA polymerase specialized sigma24 family protein